MALKAKLTIPPSLKAMMEDFAELEESGLGDVAKEMLNAGADVMLEGMIKRVPEDTGDLKSYLKRKDVQQDGYVFSVEVGVSGAPQETYIYGTVQEYGRPGPKGRTKAQSYIRATKEEDSRKINKAMRDKLEIRIRGFKK